MADEVLTEFDDGILTVTINRPETKNAINKAVAEGIAAAMDELDANDDLRVAILTGAGGSFCSGMDLKAFLKGENPVVKGRGFAGMTEHTTRKPTIAALEGYVFAGGLELALACDLSVCGESTKFGIPETKRGLVAAAGGLVKLPRMIPVRIAMEMALTGEPITAQRAFELSLVNRVVSDGTVLEEARELARLICANGPLAIMASKRIIIESSDWSRDEMFSNQWQIVGPVFKSEDAREGPKAFAEKRPPQWKGK